MKLNSIKIFSVILPIEKSWHSYRRKWVLTFKENCCVYLPPYKNIEISIPLDTLSVCFFNKYRRQRKLIFRTISQKTEKLKNSNEIIVFTIPNIFLPMPMTVPAALMIYFIHLF